MMHFNYKGKKYIIEFLPCGNIARVTQLQEDNKPCRRLFKFDKNTTVKQFTERLKTTLFVWGV